MKMMDEKRSNVFVVGIGGVTNGGKTTLCEKLRKSFPNSEVLNMDDYYWEEDSPNHTRLPEFDNYANYDIISSVDIKRFAGDINSWRSKADQIASVDTSILFVEGILIFNHSDLVPLFDKKIFVTLERDECWKRRKLRSYEPPEPMGYFDAVVWPLYLQYKDELQDQHGITYLNGNLSQEQIFNSVLHRIDLVLGNHKNDDN